MNQTVSLSKAGVSIWLDDLSRARINQSLATMITEYSVTGVTTNPTIFAAAFSDLSLYADDLARLKGSANDEIIRQLMSNDVRLACKMLRKIFEDTQGVDGRVSIEVEPGLANDAAGTVEQAILLHELVDEPNVLIKIPATQEGLAAIREATAKGISVNVTLIFSLERYREVIEAYLAGLRLAHADGLDVAKIHSVASFFISRVDTEIDARLEAIGTDEALALRGLAGVANAHLAYELFQDAFSSDDWTSLQAAGANLQRPLWASTGTKNPDYPDTMYVDELVARDCVNTLPEKTLLAYADHGHSAPSIEGRYNDAREVFRKLADLGIEYDEVVQKLEIEGVSKFVASWDELVAAVEAVTSA